MPLLLVATVSFSWCFGCLSCWASLCDFASRSRGQSPEAVCDPKKRWIWSLVYQGLISPVWVMTTTASELMVTTCCSTFHSFFLVFFSSGVTPTMFQRPTRQCWTGTQCLRRRGLSCLSRWIEAEFKNILFEEPGWGFVDMQENESEIHATWPSDQWCLAGRRGDF